MKEICHKGLARLVGTLGSMPLEPEDLKNVIDGSIDPDNLNKQRMNENLINTLTISFEWLLEHTIHAKELAIKSINEACEARKRNNGIWGRFLGWAFHFITDWGTPYHSFKSKSNPLPSSAKIGTGSGAIIGGIGGLIKSLTKRDTDFREIISDGFKGAGIGAVVGTGIGVGIGGAALAISHGKFETRCDELWDEYYSSIEEKFEIEIKNQEVLNITIDLFENKMNSLRQLCESLPADWIFTCNREEYADYMIKIALTMDLACQVIANQKINE
ncbi:MAG: hypothetical protein ACFFBP_18135 [Promethearchaeota archaeon]